MRLMKIVTAVILLMGLTSFSYPETNEIDNCYLSFRGNRDLTTNGPDKYQDSDIMAREVQTDNGMVSVSRIAGYQVHYLNNKGVPYINLKVERSASGSYESDKKNLLGSLSYLIKNSNGLNSKDILELEFNGQKIYGISKNSIDKGSTLGSFVMFPGNDIVVYFFFNNILPEYRHYDSLEEYEEQRDNFLDEYTSHINQCR